ncbi:hypothetical protein [Cellulomonas sp. ICMP 17802]|uniref:hypothetical protein n=1 Tax=Cellulomonas sp. ICMP 17802 TaxID=3239199 RepID=UPI00351B725E
MSYECPACGYPGLEAPPRTSAGSGSFEICPCCYFQFGVTDDDEGFTYATWRAQWIAKGTPWESGSHQDPPAGWDPQAQLLRVQP